MQDQAGQKLSLQICPTRKKMNKQIRISKSQKETSK